MEKRDKIIELITSNKKVFDGAFLERKATDEEIENAEKELGFSIPDSYKWFLKEIGHGGYFFEFMGYGMDGSAIFVEETLNYRKNGLPNNLLIIENCDEYVYCIDVLTDNIVSWSAYDNDGVIDTGMDFYDFFIDCIENAIDNYE